MVEYINFEDYLEEKNKFKFRKPKRKFKKKTPQYERPFYKRLTDVEPSSARRHSAQNLRSTNRKTLGHIPQIYQPPMAKMYGISPSTEKLVKTAKKASGGFIRKISKAEVYEIATKYKFNIPDSRKPVKHLGSTGIEMFRRGPNQYYLIKAL